MKKLIYVLIFAFCRIAFSQEGLVYLNQYSENKAAFLELIHRVPKNNWQINSESWALNTDPNLTTDVAVFKQTQNPRDQIVVFSSGLHGIEGYVGSAIQRQLIFDKILNQTNLKTDVAFIHALNPWGMQNKRRVEAMNIDLNRNFSSSDKIFSQTNDDYLKIDEFLNPQSKIELGFFHRIKFLFESLRLIYVYSMDTLRKSILLGQNQQPRGIYYAGRSPTKLKDKIDGFLQGNLKDYTKIIWIDLHTGYGATGKLHLLANDSTSLSGKQLTSLFKNNPIDFGDQKNFYKTEGDLVSYLNEFTTADRQIRAVVFEYGTMNSQSALGSIESLRRMIIENQAYQNAGTDDLTKKAVRGLFEDMFFPQDTHWAEQIKQQSYKVLKDLDLGL